MDLPTTAAMKKDYPLIAKDLSQEIAVLRKGLPETMQAFSALAKSATEAHDLDVKTKELIAVAIAIALRCDGCIAFHVKAARRAKTSRAELLETIGMAIYMGGGPSMVYGAEALSAFDEFEAASTG
jgi:AhpD family alkylhydroperoxidase